MRLFLKNLKKLIFNVLWVILFVSCTVKIPDNFILGNKRANILPDYSDNTIPYNIAPLNFTIEENAEAYITIVYSKKGPGFNIHGKDVLFNAKKWKNLLLKNKGDTIFFQIFLQKENKWTKYPVIKNYISNEPIDNFLVYRLIQPLYVTYHQMSIQQRDITNFKEKAIYDGRLLLNESNGQCINCHSFQDYNRSGKIQMHFRGYFSGTLITKNKRLEKVNLKTDSTISGGVYPAWHPSLDLIAYSVNKIHQNFHTKDKQKTEVQDTKSDIILYDIKENKVRKIIEGTDGLETFPYWAPDGKSLFFASADYKPKLDDLVKDITTNYENVKYNLFKIPFDTQTFEFGKTDTVFNASALGKSATFPRISPNGKYLLFAMGDYGNFHIWHKSSDLYLMDLETGEIRNLEEINSTEAESYHSWSSNGSWVVFSSRRLNGSYTRFYIAYFDGKGNFHKPFILPQKDPRFYQQFFKSYNIPEFLVKPVEFSPHDFVKAIKTTSKEASYVK